MKLTNLKIRNFRKLHNVDIALGDASFLIGANNAGKSSVLKAIEMLLGLDTKYDNLSSRYIDGNGEEVREQEDTIIEGEFHDLPQDIIGSRGFNKDRIFKNIENGIEDFYFCYRLRVEKDGKSHREIKMHETKIKDEYSKLKTPQEFIDKGIDEVYFANYDTNTKLPKSFLWDDIPEIMDVSADVKWFENPGGIAQNVLSRLPRYLYIKADVDAGNLDDSKGVLNRILVELFSTVRDKSDNYRKAQEALNELSKEMNPEDEGTEFGKMMGELNDIVDNVFPNSNLDVAANLSDPNTVLKPNFEIRMRSNITTPIKYQGTGLLRSAVFALLRYYKKRENNAQPERGLVIAFEEPELYLHPNAANNMRNIIYELASGSSQIVATTHSPYMIDLSRTEKQVLNNFKVSTDSKEYTKVICFNHSEAFKRLQENDRTRIKMVQKIDDYIARVFFSQKVVVVEGDTEDIVFKHTISIMPEEVRKEINDKYQIIKATGKATIISFAKYLKALGIDLFVVHDEDSNTSGAAKYNQPILEAIGNDESKRLMMHDCIENELEYTAPKIDKPFKAYEHVAQWGKWEDVPNRWKDIMKKVFSEYSDRL